MYSQIVSVGSRHSKAMFGLKENGKRKGKGKKKSIKKKKKNRNRFLFYVW